ncbi:hypothetical protein HY993_01150 [Candidatus Micrarchaeota archaeon]|nr:hypothetical protein [Candidatus Micrarchaeota archaeon]
MKGGYFVVEKVFYWFMAGFFVGALALAVMYEGDFLIGLWKLGRKIDEESLEKLRGKSARPRGKKRARR